MTKLVRFLIILNGFLIPLIVAVVAGALVWQIASRYDDAPGGIIVGEEVSKARKDSLVLQGVRVDHPVEIGNSDNFYMYVSVKTYEEPRPMDAEMRYSSTLRVSRQSEFINIVFLDKNYKVLGKLLEANASISQVMVPSFDYGFDRSRMDTTVHHITYQIGFKDTDGDTMLNEDDDSDLYISKLDGTGLTRVTTGWDIKYNKFVKSGKELFISYTVRDSLADEHRRNKFALYDLKSGALSTLSDLDVTLETIEKNLNK